MDPNRFAGAAKEMAGEVEEKVGAFTGDADAEVQGRIDRASGRLQSRYGMAVDTAQDFADLLRQRAREQPLSALLLAAAVGYLLGRVGRWL
jgi:uncharacterized protein YjbJ (UPF0337 family)